jgi:NAD(P)-dependent dehydrogenase (short-subunit alcohol dehydrogenase family)
VGATAGRDDGDLSTILITGANKGLGHESARRLLAGGDDVWLAARDPERGREAARELGGRFVQLDVTSESSLEAAAEHLAAESGLLDVLINNAGIAGGHVPVRDATAADVHRVFDTNVYGVVRVTRAFLPLLERSKNPVIVNVSSGMGSLAVTSDPTRLESTIVSLAYPASKAALNMHTSQYAKALAHMRVNAVDPGYTATDLNRRRGTKTVEEGAQIIVELAKLDGSGPTGSFRDAAGVVPW